MEGRCGGRGGGLLWSVGGVFREWNCNFRCVFLVLIEVSDNDEVKKWVIWKVIDLFLERMGVVFKYDI